MTRPAESTVEPSDSRRFVVVTTQRSGSNWLVDRLADHPDILMIRAEVFRSSVTRPRSYREYRDANQVRRVAGVIAPAVTKAEYLRWLRRVAVAEGAHSHGFRIMYDQLRRNPSVVPVLFATRTPILHLVRTNVLETHVSAAAARESGLYVTRSTKTTPSVTLECDGLVEALDRRAALIERHRRLLPRPQTLEVPYERLVADPDDETGRVLRFLGVEPKVLTARIQRTGHRPLCDRIQNDDEVRATLAGTIYETMLP